MTGLEMFFMVASTAVSVMSTVMQANAQAAAAEMEARINDQKARISMLQAENERQRAEVERVNAGQENAAAQRRALLKREEARRLASTQRAKYANAGVSTLWGTPALVMAETEDAGEYNAEMELWQGTEKARALEMNAVGFEQQGNIEEGNAISYRMGAAASRQQAKAIKSGMGLAIAGDVLSGATSIAKALPKTSTPTYRYG
jgi:hypothetical protein